LKAEVQRRFFKKRLIQPGALTGIQFRLFSRGGMRIQALHSLGFVDIQPAVDARARESENLCGPFGADSILDPLHSEFPKFFQGLPGEMAGVHNLKIDIIKSSRNGVRPRSGRSCSMLSRSATSREASS